jgi:hypothetical protein
VTSETVDVQVTAIFFRVDRVMVTDDVDVSATVLLACALRVTAEVASTARILPVCLVDATVEVACTASVFKVRKAWLTDVVQVTLIVCVKTTGPCGLSGSHRFEIMALD